jgi:hypothetical protein
MAMDFADTRAVDDKSVGGMDNKYFKPDKHRQRIGFVPWFTAESELEITPELEAEAASSDLVVRTAAKREIDGRRSVRRSFDEGVAKKTPPVLRWTRDKQPGFLWIRVQRGTAHYVQNAGRIYCRATARDWVGRQDEPLCCQWAAAEIAAGRTGKNANCGKASSGGLVLVLNYAQKLEDGIPVVTERAPYMREPYGEHSLWFDATIQTFQMTEGSLKDWKKDHPKRPPILRDYEVWTEEKNGFQIPQWSACDESLWHDMGPEYIEHLLTQAEKWWADPRALVARDWTDEQWRSAWQGAVQQPQRAAPQPPTMENVQRMLPPT